VWRKNLVSTQVRAGIRHAFVFDGTKSLHLDNENRRWVTTPRRFVDETWTYDLEVTVNPLHQVVMDVLDYNPETGVESVTVYDSRSASIRADTLHWSVDEDMLDFPIVSQLTYLTVRWRMSGVSSGRLAFVLRSSEHRRLARLKPHSFTLSSQRTMVCELVCNLLASWIV